VKYAQFSAVGISNMLVNVGTLILLLLLGPTTNPELLVLYNVGALVLADANSYL
jgi:putative flippase GtrA